MQEWTVGNNTNQEVTLTANTQVVEELAARIYAENDDTVQAADMLRYFPGRPELHTTTSLYDAMLASGCDES